MSEIALITSVPTIPSSQLLSVTTREVSKIVSVMTGHCLKKIFRVARFAKMSPYAISITNTRSSLVTRSSHDSFVSHVHL